MKPNRIAGVMIGCMAIIGSTGCAPRTTRSQSTAQGPTSEDLNPAAIARARADSARYPYTSADIHFVSGMIGHHAQAITISRWAATHGAAEPVRILAERIVNEQADEIVTMKNWLRDRLQPVPATGSTGMTMAMNGTEHMMQMPGMLTQAQLTQLDEARGESFDRLFLGFMIQHHRGAISMVNDLLSSHGALQDQTVFKLASDINADQSTEVARMERLLAALSSTTPSR